MLLYLRILLREAEVASNHQHPPFNHYRNDFIKETEDGHSQAQLGRRRERCYPNFYLWDPSKHPPVDMGPFTGMGTSESQHLAMLSAA